MVNNSSMGYRGELLVIFKNRTSNHLYKSLGLIGQSLGETIRNNIEATDILIKAREEYDRIIEDRACPYKEGDRICQLLVRRREKITWDEVETLEELGTTERGTEGFGSTGK